MNKPDDIPQVDEALAAERKRCSKIAMNASMRAFRDMPDRKMADGAMQVAKEIAADILNQDAPHQLREGANVAREEQLKRGRAVHYKIRDVDISSASVMDAIEDR